MPFTISHAALAPPMHWLIGRRLPLSALALGAMMPDVPYFVLGRPHGGLLSHTPLGLFVFCIPVGLLLFVIFHGLLREPAAMLLPASWRERLATLPPPRLTKVGTHMVASLGLLLGAASHLAWDAFTHPHGLAVQMLPILQEPTGRIGGDIVPAYALLQWLSSVFGLAAVMLFIAAWYRRTVPISAPSSSLGLRARVVVAGGILLAALAFGSAVGVQAALTDTRFSPLHVFLVRLSVVGPATTAVLLTFYALLVRTVAPGRLVPLARSD